MEAMQSTQGDNDAWGNYPSYDSVFWDSADAAEVFVLQSVATGEGVREMCKVAEAGFTVLDQELDRLVIKLESLKKDREEYRDLLTISALSQVNVTPYNASFSRLIANIHMLAAYGQAADDLRIHLSYIYRVLGPQVSRIQETMGVRLVHEYEGQKKLVIILKCVNAAWSRMRIAYQNAHRLCLGFEFAMNSQTDIPDHFDLPNGMRLARGINGIDVYPTPVETSTSGRLHIEYRSSADIAIQVAQSAHVRESGGDALTATNDTEGSTDALGKIGTIKGTITIRNGDDSAEDADDEAEASDQQE